MWGATFFLFGTYWSQLLKQRLSSHSIWRANDNKVNTLSQIKHHRWNKISSSSCTNSHRQWNILNKVNEERLLEKILGRRVEDSINLLVNYILFSAESFSSHSIWRANDNKVNTLSQIKHHRWNKISSSSCTNSHRQWNILNKVNEERLLEKILGRRVEDSINLLVNYILFSAESFSSWDQYVPKRKNVAPHTRTS